MRRLCAEQIKGSELASGVRTVASGQPMLDPATTARLMHSLREHEQQPEPRDEAPAGPTSREREILELVGEGLTNRQIGERLFLSEKTVENHVSRMLDELGVERRIQAAVPATQRQHTGGAPGPGP